MANSLLFSKPKYIYLTCTWLLELTAVFMTRVLAL